MAIGEQIKKSDSPPLESQIAFGSKRPQNCQTAHILGGQAQKNTSQEFFLSKFNAGEFMRFNPLQRRQTLMPEPV